MQIHFKIWPKQIKVEGIHELWVPTLRHLGSHLQSVWHSTNILCVLTQASSCSINLNISCSSESSAFLHICHQEPKLGIQKYRSPLQTLVQKWAISKKKLCGAAVGNFQTLSVTNLSLQSSSASGHTFQLMQKMEESWLQTLSPSTLNLPERGSKFWQIRMGLCKWRPLRSVYAERPICMWVQLMGKW